MISQSIVGSCVWIATILSLFNIIRKCLRVAKSYTGAIEFVKQWVIVLGMRILEPRLEPTPLRHITFQSVWSIIYKNNKYMFLILIWHFLDTAKLSSSLVQGIQLRACLQQILVHGHSGVYYFPDTPLTSGDFVYWSPTDNIKWVMTSNHLHEWQTLTMKMVLQKCLGNKHVFNNRKQWKWCLN